jgi:radical SAM protein with 4Fe4S-binding SPASM domain
MKQIRFKKLAFLMVRKLKIPLWIQKILYDLFYRLESILKYGDPFFARIICFEINTGCNRKCTYCPVSLDKENINNLMSWETFKAGIRQLKEIKFSGSIMYHFYNEPLMDNRIVEFVQYTTNELPGAISRIFTNSDYLNLELAEALFSAGLNDIHITDHNLTKGRIAKRVSPIVEKFKNRVTVDEGLGHSEDRPIDNRGGLIDVVALGATEYLRKDCKVVWEEVKIDVNGNVLLCTNDYYRQHIFGNINKQNFKDIWFGEEYSRVRNNLRKGLAEYDICLKCNYASPEKIK